MVKSEMLQHLWDCGMHRCPLFSCGVMQTAWGGGHWEWRGGVRLESVRALLLHAV